MPSRCTILFSFFSFFSIVDLADACFKKAIINMFQEVKETMVKELKYNNDP